MRKWENGCKSFQLWKTRCISKGGWSGFSAKLCELNFSFLIFFLQFHNTLSSFQPCQDCIPACSFLDHTEVMITKTCPGLVLADVCMHEYYINKRSWFSMDLSLLVWSGAVLMLVLWRSSWVQYSHHVQETVYHSTFIITQLLYSSYLLFSNVPVVSPQSGEL